MSHPWRYIWPSAVEERFDLPYRQCEACGYFEFVYPQQVYRAEDRPNRSECAAASREAESQSPVREKELAILEATRQ